MRIVVVGLSLVAIPAIADAPKRLKLAAEIADPGASNTGEITGVTATATSTLCDKTTKTCYDAKQLVDGKTETAWCEGASGDGEDTSITLTLPKAEEVDSIFIVPHYAKSFARASENNRLAKVEITTDAGTGTVEIPDVVPFVKKHNDVKEREGGDESTMSRDDRIQYGIGVTIDVDPAAPTKTVTLKIKSVYRGTVHDTCASEIRLYRAK